MKHKILFCVDVKICFKKLTFYFSFKKLIIIFALKILIRNTNYQNNVSKQNKAEFWLVKNLGLDQPTTRPQACRFVDEQDRPEFTEAYFGKITISDIYRTQFRIEIYNLFWWTRRRIPHRNQESIGKTSRKRH